ncbi:MAG: helix-turn-helix domain-containing protein, partial [Dehalococcoidia bacterium]
MEQWLTTQEVSRRLGVGVTRVNTLAKQGRLAAAGGGRQGRARRYRQADVEAFAAIPRRAGGSNGGGAPRVQFNRRTTGHRSRQLQPVRRLLPPLPRKVFEAAAAAAAQRAGGRTPHERRIRRIRAVAAVVLMTARAWALPAHTAAEQQANVVRALRPW